MPMHDWTRVPIDLCRTLHFFWISELNRELQQSLPLGYYALIERDSSDAAKLGQKFLAIYLEQGDRRMGHIELVLPAPGAKRSQSLRWTRLPANPGESRTVSQESFAVGDTLSTMPIYLTPGLYVEVPLEATYMAAWQMMPQRWRTVLEAPAM